MSLREAEGKHETWWSWQGQGQKPRRKSQEPFRVYTVYRCLTGRAIYPPTSPGRNPTPTPKSDTNIKLTARVLKHKYQKDGGGAAEGRSMRTTCRRQSIPPNLTRSTLNTQPPKSLRRHACPSTQRRNQGALVYNIDFYPPHMPLHKLRIIDSAQDRVGCRTTPLHFTEGDHGPPPPLLFFPCTPPPHRSS